MHMYAKNFYRCHGIVRAQVSWELLLAWPVSIMENMRSEWLYIWGLRYSHFMEITSHFHLWEQNCYGIRASVETAAPRTDYCKRGNFVPGLRQIEWIFYVSMKQQSLPVVYLERGPYWWSCRLTIIKAQCKWSWSQLYTRRNSRSKRTDSTMLLKDKMVNSNLASVKE